MARVDIGGQDRIWQALPKSNGRVAADERWSSRIDNAIYV